MLSLAGPSRAGAGAAPAHSQARPQAQPLPQVDDCAKGVSAEQVLARVNAMRAQRQYCGPKPFAAVAPLSWDARLQASAQAYADELSLLDKLTHIDQRGQGLRERVLERGYVFRQVAENLAGGPQYLDEVMAGWLGSEGHCENLMEPRFQDIGMACVAGPGELERYWVMHLGRKAK
ncbi:CAP domain-containing protein [Roseateles sp. PN1]|uniref:CAP domain-containing protein n=1 Tax=Roseateles sp. PN1 TaxID=3137372 RepID=UPI003139AC5D